VKYPGQFGIAHGFARIGELEGRKRAGIWFIDDEDAQRFLEKRRAQEKPEAESEA